jgi:methanogenic corrinoid protein MtbC1
VVRQDARLPLTRVKEQVLCAVLVAPAGNEQGGRLMPLPMSNAQVSRPAANDANAPPLSTLVYRSRAVAPLSADDLYRLTLESQLRNRRESITGVMLYDDSRFFQWLEGPRDGVGRVMKSIRNDPRHTDIEILNDNVARERAFGNWSMKLAAPRAMAAPWSDAILEPPAEVVADLRQRPNAAPAVLIKLVPRASGNPGGASPAAEPGSQGLLGRSTAAILKSVILAAVIPSLASQHGVAMPGGQPLPAHPRASELAELLVASDQAAARELIDELHTAEGSVWPLYASVFEPAARRLGDLWAEDLCSEFDVTLGLCRIQTAARLLSAHAPQQSGPRAPGAAVLIAPEPGELHRLGAALDSEVLWHAGWAPQCEYPADDKTLQELVSTTWFDALDVSLSAAFEREHLLPSLAKTIADARRASQNPAMLVVVGGRIFVDHKTSAAAVGADLTSVSALKMDELILAGIAKRDASSS